MIIKCRVCGKEFDKASHRNQHEKDAHKQDAGKGSKWIAEQIATWDSKKVANA